MIQQDTFPILEARNMQQQVAQLRQDIKRFKHSALMKLFFLQNMSHELRNPLTAVCGFADAIAEIQSMNPDEETQALVQRMKENSNHLLSTINDLLTTTREECLRRQEQEEQGLPLDDEPAPDASVDELCAAVAQAQQHDKERSQLMESISQQVHEQLDHIVDFANKLSQDMPNDDFKEEIQTFLDLITENSQMLLTLVDDIRDWGLMQSGVYRTRFTQLAPAAVCRTCIQSVKHRVPSGVELILDMQIPEDFTIESDYTRLQQVLTNLLVNATKYTSQGSITLTCKQVESNLMEFSVTDTGCGIDPQNAEVIFHRFEKLNSFKKGSGLGLHICRLIAKQLNCRIFLDTSNVHGARFVLQHPVRATV